MSAGAAFGERVARAVVGRRALVFALWAAALGVAIPGLPRLSVDNSSAAFYPEGTVERRAFDRFAATFGPASALRAVVDGERLFTPDGLEFLGRLEVEAARVPGVVAVDGPLTRRRRSLSPQVASDPAAMRARIAGSALDRALGFASSGASAVSLLIGLEPASSAERREQLAALERLGGSAPRGVRVAFVGLPTLDRALDDAARDVVTRLLPILVSISFLLLLATFREASAVLVPMSFVVAVGGVLFGLMGWCGVAIDLVVAVLPPVLFSIALAVAVHLLIRCRDLEATGLEARDATIATFADKGRALVYTTLSTMAGFGALAATPVAPIRTLGGWGACAMLLTGIAAFTLYPCLLALTAGRRSTLPERRLELRLERFGRALAERAAERRGLVLAAYAATALVAAFGFTRLEVESNALAYFPESAPVRLDFARAERLGMGLATIELLAEVPAPGDGGVGAAEDDPRSAAALAALGRVGRRLRELSLSSGGAAISVVSLVDLLDDVAADSPLARAGPDDELRARLLPLVVADRDGERGVRRFLSADGRSARITLFVETAGYERIDPLVEAALAAARAEAPTLSWTATGQLPLLLATQRRLLDTLATSLAWALPLLGLIFLRLLGSARGALLALVPNVWPVIAILGGMGWAGVPVDLATVMVASIVLGLVVDDTIHTLAPYRELASRVGARRAVTDRLEKTAPAFLLTGLVLASGFAVCALSDFAPVARFGALSVVAIAIALAADLLLVPALFGEKEGQSPVSRD